MENDNVKSRLLSQVIQTRLKRWMMVLVSIHIIRALWQIWASIDDQWAAIMRETLLPWIYAICTTVTTMAVVSFAVLFSVVCKPWTMVLALEMWLYLLLTAGCLAINIAFITILGIHRPLFLLNCHQSAQLCDDACRAVAFDDAQSPCAYKWKESLILVVLDTAGLLFVIWRYRREQCRLNQINMAPPLPPPYRPAMETRASKEEDGFQTIELQ
ncbi:hypothetical protein BC940DRAFT_331219 [Gongronella butleri]|nr:hypothetical protein BC940DRAFT_331219 [Gongronella butleri]